jgi:hypothetical protein
VSLDELTSRESVLEAMAEYDKLGGPAFLAKYGYRTAKAYFIEHDGRRYDSKAVAGVAFGKQYPAIGPLRAEEFSGGAATVQAKLEGLGFVVSDDKAAAALDADTLGQLRAKFLAAMPHFVDFQQPGERYETEERRYKDELREAFLAEVQPLAAVALNDEAAR